VVPGRGGKAGKGETQATSRKKKSRREMMKHVAHNGFYEGVWRRKGFRARRGKNGERRAKVTVLGENLTGDRCEKA